MPDLATKIEALEADEFKNLVAALIEAEQEDDSGTRVRRPRTRGYDDGVVDFQVVRGQTPEPYLVFAGPDAGKDLRNRVDEVARSGYLRRPRLVFQGSPAADDVAYIERTHKELRPHYLLTRHVREMLGRNLAVRRKFFEVGPEPEGRLHKLVLRWAEGQAVDQLHPVLRLTLLVLIVIALTGAPWRVGSSEAIAVAVVGLAIFAAAAACVPRALAALGKKASLFRPRPLELVASLPGVTLRLRFQRVRVAPGGTLALVAVLGILRGLRYVGLALAGLAFFVLWALVYLLAWGIYAADCAPVAADCTGSFAGFGDSPALGEFFYFAVRSAFLEPPPSPEAFSRLAKGLLVTEFLTAAVLLATLARRIGFSRSDA